MTTDQIEQTLADLLRAALGRDESDEMLAAMLRDGADRLGNPQHQGNLHAWPRHRKMLNALADHLAAEQAAALRATERVAPEVDEVARVLHAGWCCDGAGSEDCQFDDEGDRIDASAVLALFAAQPTVAEVKAAAWDEGYQRGVRDEIADAQHGADNPYRVDRIGGGA